MCIFVSIDIQFILLDFAKDFAKFYNVTVQRQTDQWTDRSMDGWTNGWTNRWTNIPSYTDVIDRSENDDFQTNFAIFT